MSLCPFASINCASGREQQQLCNFDAVQPRECTNRLFGRATCLLDTKVWRLQYLTQPPQQSYREYGSLATRHGSTPVFVAENTADVPAGKRSGLNHLLHVFPGPSRVPAASIDASGEVVVVRPAVHATSPARDRAAAVYPYRCDRSLFRGTGIAGAALRLLRKEGLPGPPSQAYQSSNGLTVCGAKADSGTAVGSLAPLQVLSLTHDTTPYSVHAPAIDSSTAQATPVTTVVTKHGTDQHQLTSTHQYFG